MSKHYGFICREQYESYFTLPLSAVITGLLEAYRRERLPHVDSKWLSNLEDSLKDYTDPEEFYRHGEIESMLDFKGCISCGGDLIFKIGFKVQNSPQTATVSLKLLLKLYHYFEEYTGINKLGDEFWERVKLSSTGETDHQEEKYNSTEVTQRYAIGGFKVCPACLKPVNAQSIVVSTPIKLSEDGTPRYEQAKHQLIWNHECFYSQAQQRALREPDDPIVKTILYEVEEHFSWILGVLKHDFGLLTAPKHRGEILDNFIKLNTYRAEAVTTENIAYTLLLNQIIELHGFRVMRNSFLYSQLCTIKGIRFNTSAYNPSHPGFEGSGFVFANLADRDDRLLLKQTDYVIRSYGYEVACFEVYLYNIKGKDGYTRENPKLELTFEIKVDNSIYKALKENPPVRSGNAQKNREIIREVFLINNIPTSPE